MEYKWRILKVGDVVVVRGKGVRVATVTGLVKEPDKRRRIDYSWHGGNYVKLRMAKNGREVTKAAIDLILCEEYEAARLQDIRRIHTELQLINEQKALLQRDIAQTEEHAAGGREVAGSNPAVPTILVST